MAVVEIQVVHLQPAQGRVTGIEHMLARQAALGGARVLHRPETHLAGHAETIPRQPQRAQRFTHHALGFAMAIDLGVVEEVDPVVPGQRDQFACLARADLLPERQPGTEGQG